MTHSPSTTMLCQSSSGTTEPPSSSAQKLLSASRSAASNTTICRLIFTPTRVPDTGGGKPGRRVSSVAGELSPQPVEVSEDPRRDELPGAGAEEGRTLVPDPFAVPAVPEQ